MSEYSYFLYLSDHKPLATESINLIQERDKIMIFSSPQILYMALAIVHKKA
jgi:hypothetical protein